MKKILLIIAVSILFISCRQSEQHGDAAPAAAAPAPMYDHTTSLGFKIQSNDYDFDPDYIDDAFLQTENCLGYSDTPTDIFIVLITSKKAFPCTSYPDTGCGGSYKFPIIDISTYKNFDLLTHEYVHYILDYHTGNPDNSHESSFFDQCS